jgi:glycosyltransferase involved in cell wall biosynthesis
MKVVVDGRCIPNQLDGTGRVAINLIKALSNSDDNLDLHVLIRSDLSKNIRGKIPGSTRVLNIPYRHIHPYTVFGLGKVVDKLGADVFYSPHMLQPFWMNTPGVITIHDTMWFDQTWMQAQGKRLRMIAGKFYFRSLVELSVRKANKIIVPSKSTCRDLSRFWPNRIKDCHVVYHGIDQSFAQSPNNQLTLYKLKHFGLAGKKFFLHITNGKPYKNTPRVVEAFSRVADDLNLSIAIVGRRSAFTDSILSLISASLAKERVKFLGSVDDQDLAVLFHAARALIFPSLYEGFGLPVIEAMSCGCPVIASNHGSLGEVSGNCALSVNPESVEEISKAILALEKDDSLREFLIEKGLKRAGEFSWDKAATEIIEILHQA